MSIHRLDVFRFLFGDPERIRVSARPDPSHDFPHEDGLAFYILEYQDGLRAIGLDNCFAWVDHRIDSAGRRHRRRREGDDRLAGLPGGQPVHDRLDDA